MPQPGAIVAAAFVAAVERLGLDPDPALRLLAHRALDAGPAPVVEDPHDLGSLHEQVVSGTERVRRGAWYTPRWLAEDLVGRAFAAADGWPGCVSDPACGGGVFLLAAADRLAARDSPRAVIARLWGCDLDPLAAAVTEAALWWWSAVRGEPVVAGDRVVVGDTLTATDLPATDVVVGNPPFLGQLRTSTASDATRRDALRDRFGDALRPYTDEAWLFLLRAVGAVRPGGSVALVQPTSLLGARDAGPIRRAIDGRARLVGCWIDRAGAFDASVHACAPVLRVGTGGDNDWTGPLASALAVPDVALDATDRLGARARTVAGFRDEYYGLVDAVHEGGSGPRLVTSGSIDPLRRRDTTTRFAKQTWTDPRVDVAGVDERAARWLAAQAGPKVLVATQTRVIEAVVDERDELVACVPVIVVRPHDPADVWHLVAALHAPVASAWMLRRTVGTALSNDACKPTVSLLDQLPLPRDRACWDRAATVARAIAAGDDRWEEFGAEADAAYGIDDVDLRNWWLDRLPLR